MEAHYCELCECVCVACVQFNGCDECELKYPELIADHVLDLWFPEG